MYIKAETENALDGCMPSTDTFGERATQAVAFLSRLKFDPIIDHSWLPLGGDDVRKISPEISEAVRVYIEELSHLCTLRNPATGESIFAGLGFYPAAGADALLLLTASHFGGMCLESLHEGELLSLLCTAAHLGLSWETVTGCTVRTSLINRDLPSSVKERASEGYFKPFRRPGSLSNFCGSTDWRHVGRLIHWNEVPDDRYGGFLLPSAPADFRALDSFLRGENFDYLCVKGSLRYAFQGGQVEAERWLTTMAQRYLAANATVLVAKSDEDLIPHLVTLGFELMPAQKGFEYPKECTWDAPVITKSVALGSTEIIHNRNAITVVFEGGFRLLHRSKPAVAAN